MTTPPTFTVPDNVTFEQAIALTHSLLTAIEQKMLSEAEIAAAIARLIKTANGARGFFVTYLSGSSDLADQPSSGVVEALRSTPETIAELLVKNVAMSTAMAITHRRHDSLAMAAGSDQVRTRCEELVRQLQMAEIVDQIMSLIASVKTGQGQYQGFLDRWQYDEEQRQGICQVMERLVALP